MEVSKRGAIPPISLEAPPSPVCAPLPAMIPLAPASPFAVRTIGAEKLARDADEKMEALLAHARRWQAATAVIALRK